MALLLEPRETTRMTKMAGVPRARAWFTKSTVSWTPTYWMSTDKKKGTKLTKIHVCLGDAPEQFKSQYV